MSITGELMMLVGMLTVVGAASAAIYAWVLQDTEREIEPVRAIEPDEELRPAA